MVLLSILGKSKSGFKHLELSGPCWSKRWCRWLWWGAGEKWLRSSVEVEKWIYLISSVEVVGVKDKRGSGEEGTGIGASLQSWPQWWWWWLMIDDVQDDDEDDDEEDEDDEGKEWSEKKEMGKGSRLECHEYSPYSRKYWAGILGNTGRGAGAKIHKIRAHMDAFLRPRPGIQTHPFQHLSLRSPSIFPPTPPDLHHPLHQYNIIQYNKI